MCDEEDTNRNDVALLEYLKNAENYFSMEKWDKAREIFFDLLKKNPDDHWLLTRIGTTFYEEKNYKEALQYEIKALKISPECPLVLWDYAGTLDMLGKEKEAIKVWKMLLKRGEKSIAYGECGCGEGIVWARSLLNDSIYRIGLAYSDLGRNKLAAKYVQKHIENRIEHRYRSIYRLKQVREGLNKIKGSKS